MQSDIDKLTKVVRSFESTVGEKEIELRFGNSQSGSFKAGVSRAFADKCIRMLETSDPHTMQSTHWNEHHDFYYTHNNRSYRTRVLFNTKSLEINSVTTEKNKIISQVVDGDVSMKLSLSRERTVTPPSCVDPTHVRIQQRKSFFYGKVSAPIWRYDVSMVWDGASMIEAGNKQKNEEPRFEVEIELLDHTYMDCKTPEHVAESFLLKGKDFL